MLIQQLTEKDLLGSDYFDFFNGHCSAPRTQSKETPEMVVSKRWKIRRHCALGSFLYPSIQLVLYLTSSSYSHKK